MKVIGIVSADLEQTPLGTASRQAEELLGVPVLRRTVERVCRAGRLDGVQVACPADQAGRCRALLEGLAATVRPVDTEEPPYRRLIRAARKWSLDGWRGGLGGATSLDEYAHGAVAVELAREESADAVWLCPGAAVLVDPDLIDAMVDHYQRVAREMRCTFAPVPPGLAGTVFEATLLAELAPQQIPPGWLLAYKPDQPQVDLAFKDCCYPCPEAARHASGRLIVDTRRALETVTELLNAQPDPDVETAGRWLLERSGRHVPPLPREVEIELTTEDQLADTPLRPRGSRVPGRGAIGLAAVEQIAGELAAYDDSLVVLGGFGEPLLHPAFEEVCRILSAAGVYGVAIRTNGLSLEEGVFETFFRHRVDVLNVLLDAWSEELYERLHPGRRLADITAALNRLSEARVAGGRVEPLIVPQITKSVDTVEQLDDFFDGWVRTVGWASIEGFSHYAGQLPDRGVMDMSPPSRCPCRRVRSRCLVLADGRMTRCDQDFKGLTAVGRIGDATLGQLWRSEALKTARDLHQAARWDELPLCGTCAEWHRP